jgi:CDP-4-dehydro-6-deoxyglucose reductase, E3
MPNVTLASGAHFSADTGISLVDAAARAGFAFPYSCKTGRCSTCKCKVIEGETIALEPETGLSELEKAEGWILACVRSAQTDLRLDVDCLEGVTLPPIKMLPSRISSIERLANDVVRVVLRLPPTAAFEFIPGQYVDLIGPNNVRRSYSLASADAQSKQIEFHIRAVEGGAFSEYWFSQAKPNDLLRLNGPLGTFFLRDTQDIDLIFLATGTGIAPVKAILEALSTLPAEKVPRSVKVLWGGRTQQDLYFNVRAIPGKYEYMPVLSRADEAWAGARGYVQQVLLDSSPDLKNSAVYACGSDSMIHSAKTLLIDAGLPAHRFYSDAFVSSAAHSSDKG